MSRFNPQEPVAYDVKLRTKSVILNPTLFVTTKKNGTKVYMIRGKSAISDVKSIGVIVSKVQAVEFEKYHANKRY